MTKHMSDQELLSYVDTTARNAADITFSMRRCWECGIHKRLSKLAEKGLCVKYRIGNADFFTLPVESRQEK